jgi:hypothetical protein
MKSVSSGLPDADASVGCTAEGTVPGLTGTTEDQQRAGLAEAATDASERSLSAVDSNDDDDDDLDFLKDEDEDTSDKTLASAFPPLPDRRRHSMWKNLLGMVHEETATLSGEDDTDFLVQPSSPLSFARNRHSAASRQSPEQRSTVDSRTSFQRDLDWNSETAGEHSSRVRSLDAPNPTTREQDTHSIRSSAVATASALGYVRAADLPDPRGRRKANGDDPGDLLGMSPSNHPSESSLASSNFTEGAIADHRRMILQAHSKVPSPDEPPVNSQMKRKISKTNPWSNMLSRSKVLKRTTVFAECHGFAFRRSDSLSYLLLPSSIASRVHEFLYEREALVNILMICGWLYGFGK